MCFSVPTFQLFTEEAKAGDATVMSMHVAARLVWKVGSFPLFKTQSPNQNNTSSTLEPREFVSGDPHRSLWELESIPARK
jgi:hypothetical protein